MRMRLVTVWLLILAMISMAGGHPSGNGNRRAGRQERILTPQEEEEARAIAQRFKERWQEKNDFGQIMDELFVHDFRERLWQVPHEELPWLLVDKKLFAYASSKELQRYYIAGTNFLGLFFNLHVAAGALRKQAKNSEDDLEMAEILSPEIIDVVLSNETFRKLKDLSEEEGSDEQTKEDDDRQPAERSDSAPVAGATAATANMGQSTEQSEDAVIETLAQLNDASATLEKATELMRKRLADLSRKAPAKSAKSDKESESDAPDPSLSSFDEDRYGYSKDMPVIYIEVFPFYLHLVKIDGHLKILSASIGID